MGDNMKKMLSYRPNWPWSSMRGSELCLKWNVRDLRTLDIAIDLCPKHEVAVQAGGNLGLFPKRLAESFKNVYTFEPDEYLFSCLEANAPEENIVPIRAAIGDTNDPVSLECTRRDSSGRPVHEGMTHIAGVGEIPQIRLDDLKLSACDLIYFDIEGYELNALKGGVQTIIEYRPVIGVEVNGNIAHYGETKQSLRNWLHARGYRKLARYHGDDIYVYGQTIHTR